MAKYGTKYMNIKAGIGRGDKKAQEAAFKDMREAKISPGILNDELQIKIYLQRLYGDIYE